MLDKNKVEFFFFNFFVKLCKVLGLGGTRRLAIVFSFIVFKFLAIRKKVVITNLKKAFPEKPGNEIKQIALSCYKNIFITFFELMYLPNMTDGKISGMIEVANPDLITDGVAEGKGLIFLTGHFGSWEIAALVPSTKFNLPMNLLVQPQRNPLVTKWLNSARSRNINNVMEAGLSVRKIYEVIKKGELVGIVGDQRGPREGVRVNFFGINTSLYPGAAAFALKTKCSVLASIVIRKPDYNYKVIFEKLSFENLPENFEEQIREVNQRFISFIEKYVRMYPEQYFWMHNLWKY
ncbi:MAG: lysophospholipid acyltransferase family protein [Ignavibacteriales bacterium]|nr:lysophospholipid acyltransferase family protein [Ignavibacteriales bacterium]